MMQGFLSRVVALLALCLVAAVIAVAGFVFLAVALYFYLSSITTPDLAALYTGGAILVLAVGLVAFAMSLFRPPRRRLGLGRGRSAADEELAAEAAVAAASLASIARRHSSILVIGALAAGFVLGLSPRVRRVLWALLR